MKGRYEVRSPNHRKNWVAAIVHLKILKYCWYDFNIQIPIQLAVKVTKMTKILVIEDDNLIRETVLELLESRGFEAVGAENGQVGIQLATDQIPDLILSDVMMPERNGFEVFATLRSHPATASIPFIFMTASEMEKAIELKADGYLKKPCSATEMLGAIATQLQKPRVTNPKHQKVQDNSAPSNLRLRTRNQKSRFEVASVCWQ